MRKCHKCGGDMEPLGSVEHATSIGTTYHCKWCGVPAIVVCCKDCGAELDDRGVCIPCAMDRHLERQDKFFRERMDHD